MPPFTEIALRLVVAALLGAVIGADRGRLEWAAGLRTHMLVCVGAALAIIVSAYGFFDALRHDHVVLDPSRIAAQVISGVGFLGAGTILFLQREQVVRGLTTAAGLWAVASIGLAAGSGMFAAAFFATALLWVILALLKPFERRYIAGRRRAPGLTATVSGDTPLARIEEALQAGGVPFERLVLRRREGDDLVIVRCAQGAARATLQQAAEALRGIDGVKEVGLLGKPG